LKKYLTLLVAVSLVVFGSNPAQATPPVPSVVNITSTSGNGTAAGATDASVSVSWESKIGAGVATYSVRATAVGQSNGTSSTPNCSSGTCTSSVVGLVGGVSYSFVVTAIASDGSQASASPVTFTARSVPTAPTPLAPSTARGEVVLSWAAPTNTGGLALSGYTIEEDSDAVAPILITNPTTSTYSVKGLAGGVQYNFSIKATNALGSSTAAPFAAVSSTSVPGVPGSVSASVSGSTVNVSWVAPRANGSPISGYKIYLVNSTTNADVGQFTSATQSPGSIANVPSGSYSVQVVATNADGDSPRSVATAPFTIGSGTLVNTPVLTPSTISNLDIGATVSLSASAPSGGVVTMAVESSPDGACTFNGGTLRAVSPGTCTITATTPSTALYAAGALERNVVVKSGQVITFLPISSQTMPGPYTLSASSSSNLPVRFLASGSCTNVGNQLTFIAPGGCSVTASQPGNANFSAAPNVVRSFVITSTAGGGGGFFVTPPGAELQPPKASTVFSKVKKGTAKKVSTSKASTRTKIKLGQAVRASFTGLTPGARVSSVLQVKSGASYFLSASVVKAGRSYTTPPVKLKKKGIYRIIVTVGAETRTLRIKVS
jgi:large repetitive protein